MLSGTYAMSGQGGGPSKRSDGRTGQPVGLAGRRVLVVEDEALVAFYLEAVLQDLGCAVIGPAQTVSEGLQLARGDELDAALLDLNLRGHSAWPIAELLRDRGVPFVIVSGYAGLDPAREAITSSVLSKPVTAREIELALVAALAAREA